MISALLRAISCFVFWTVVVIAPSPAHATGDRLALLIGNSRYEHATPLRNPENDIELMATSLKSAGFRTFVGKNASQHEMSRLVDDFIGVARATTRPTLLVYFAGHGVQLGDINYLIPVDAKTSAPEEIRQHSFDATALLKRLLSIDPELAMLVLDACRDNPFDTAKRSLIRGLHVQGIESGIGSRASQLIAFATAPGTTADDGDTGNSPYASALAESIISPGLSLEAVFRETRRKVVDRTKGQQQPWENASLFSDFYFIPPESRPAPPTDEATFWDLASIVNSAEIYQRYVDRFPTGTFADLARRKIISINTDFLYRRKAELFPILKITNKSVFKGCAEGGVFSTLTKLGNHFEGMKGQIVYVDLQLPGEWLYCHNVNGKISYEFMRFIRSATGNCALFQFSNPSVTTDKTPCLAEIDHPIVKPAESRRIFAEGGIVIDDIDTKLWLPAGQTEFHEFMFELAEAQVEEMFASFSGLMRVRTFREDIYLSILLEPVDPKTLGVSWKFDNTVSAAKDAPDTQLPDIEALAAASSPSLGASETSFSIWRNRATSGHDLRQLKSTDEGACARECQGEQRCRAYVYDKWNRWCFLKEAVTEMRIDPKYDLALRPNVSPPPLSSVPRRVIHYRGKQFPDGGTFHSVADYQACARQCLSIAQCVAFTFDRKAGWAAPCKVMTSTGEYFARAGADSGVVRQDP